MRHLGALLLAGCTVSACAQVIGTDHYVDAWTGGGGSTGSGGNASSVAAGGSDCCLPEVPPGWLGLAAMYQGADAPPACGGAFDEAGPQGGVDPTYDPSDCECSCGDPSGGGCTQTASFAAYTTAFCSGNPATTVPTSNGVCVDGLVQVASMTASAIQALPGTCASDQRTTEPTPEWGNRLGLCVADLVDGCPSDLCDAAGPEGYETAGCIYDTGERECPSEGYTERTVFYEELDNSLTCASCTCGTAKGETCNGVTTLFAQAGCNTEAYQKANDNACADGGGTLSPYSLRLDVTGPTGGTCESSGGELSGDVIPAGPVTVCCVAG